MSTISSSHHGGGSPLERLKAQVAAGVSAGTIQSSDQDALDKALDNIDQSLRGSAPGTGGAGKPPSREAFQAKISSLIDDQVGKGTLTSDQAKELKDVFAKLGAQGPRGPEGGPPPPRDRDGDGSGSGDPTEASGATSGTDAVQKLIADFLGKLKATLAEGSDYGASGTQTASAAKSTGKILDTSA